MVTYATEKNQSRQQYGADTWNPLDIHAMDKSDNFMVPFKNLTKELKVMFKENSPSVECTYDTEKDTGMNAKGEVRSIFKSIEKGSPLKLKDVLRVSFTFDSMKEVATAFISLLEKYGASNVCRFKNRLSGDKITGYRDILANYLLEGTDGV